MQALRLSGPEGAFDRLALPAAAAAAVHSVWELARHDARVALLLLCFLPALACPCAQAGSMLACPAGTGCAQ
eukprot:scaffold268838_cov22-Tisochrysis_lutea.AAC.1